MQVGSCSNTTTIYPAKHSKFAVLVHSTSPRYTDFIQQQGGRWIQLVFNQLPNQGKRCFCRWQFWHVLHLVWMPHVRTVSLPGFRALFSPLILQHHSLTNSSEVQKKRGEACRHYSKTEFLSGFLLKAYYQVPVIKARKAPLDFLSPWSIADPPLWKAEICCSSIIFLIITPLKKTFAY